MNDVTEETEAIKKHEIEWDEKVNELQFLHWIRKLYMNLHQTKI